MALKTLASKGREEVFSGWHQLVGGRKDRFFLLGECFYSVHYSPSNCWYFNKLHRVLKKTKPSEEEFLERICVYKDRLADRTAVMWKGWNGADPEPS